MRHEREWREWITTEIHCGSRQDLLEAIDAYQPTYQSGAKTDSQVARDFFRIVVKAGRREAGCYFVVARGKDGAGLAENACVHFLDATGLKVAAASVVECVEGPHGTYTDKGKRKKHGEGR